MKCQIIKINSQKPEKRILAKAADIIKKGGLVAFPTETVYGLGANALNRKAVRKIFEAKGRPSDNPIIVHIADSKTLFELAQKIPKIAEVLVKKFWPGPLTLVLFKKKIVPKEVTAGAKTVAIRLPKNKIALELIRASGTAIAAPSANLAGRSSPTTAQHVFEDLGEKIDLILDGGLTKIGVESTVIDLTVSPAQVLRPGGVSVEELRKVFKEITLHPFLLGKKLKKGIMKSPGMKYRHYAPKAPLILIEGKDKEKKAKAQQLISFYQKQNKKVGVMAFSETKKLYPKADVVLTAGPRKNLEAVAKNLFKILREFDKQKVDIILAESVPENGIGLAIMHRLRKAAVAR